MLLLIIRLFPLLIPTGMLFLGQVLGPRALRGQEKVLRFAAQKAAEVAAKKAVDSGMKTCDVYVKGPGAGRESAIRALQTFGLKINLIKDVTPIPHNGCRPPKRRRV